MSAASGGIPSARSPFASISQTFIIALGDIDLRVGSPTSVTVVVLGGSFISGGRSTVASRWRAIIILNLIIALVFVLEWNVAVRDIFQGLVIIGVLRIAEDSRAVA